ncbi:hypothetical protein K9M16_03070 [Candidatus Babeliales bacterium]|nr:hypothetical protein [Candidatus Babeliales bacterium]
MLVVFQNKINKNFYLFFILLFLNFRNSNAIVNKSGVEKIQTWLCLAIAVDQLFPDNYKIWPKLNIEINNPKLLQFKNYNNLKQTIYIPAFINNTLLSATEENENLVSAIINILIQIKTFAPSENFAEASEITDFLKSKIGISIISEKIIEILANSTINNSVKQKILKRALKILTFTGTKILADYIRCNKIESKYHLNFTPTKYINIFIEKTAIEFLAEFLQRFIINDPIQKQLEIKMEILRKENQKIIKNQLKKLPENQKLQEKKC